MKIGKFFAALVLVLFLASGASAYTLDQIIIENKYGTGENSALLVVDFSDASGDSFAWVVNFEDETINTSYLLGLLNSSDPNFNASVPQGALVAGIGYDGYSAAHLPPTGFWYAYSSDDLGETWASMIISLDSVGDGGTIGLIYGTDVCFPETPLNTVPVPAAVWLLGSGLVGLAGIRRRLR